MSINPRFSGAVSLVRFNKRDVEKLQERLQQDGITTKFVENYSSTPIIDASYSLDCLISNQDLYEFDTLDRMANAVDWERELDDDNTQQMGIVTSLLNAVVELDTKILFKARQHLIDGRERVKEGLQIPNSLSYHSDPEGAYQALKTWLQE